MNFNIWELILLTGIIIVSFYLGTLTYNLLKPVFIHIYKEFYKYYTWGSSRRFWEMIHRMTDNKEFMAQLREDAQRNFAFARVRALEPIFKGDLVSWNQLTEPLWDIVDTTRFAQYRYINVRVD